MLDAEPAGSISVLTSPDRARLVMEGEVDVAMNDQLSEAVKEIESLDVAVDVETESLTFMDSSVIALIAHLASKSKHQVTFIRPPDVVRFLLDLTQIGELVEVRD